jgi:hypothetical protein
VIPTILSELPELPKQSIPEYIIVDELKVPTKKIVYAFPEPGILPVKEELPLKLIA